MNTRMKYFRGSVVVKVDGPLKSDGTTTVTVLDGPLGGESDSGDKLVATDCLMPGEESIREGAKAVVIYEAGEWHIHSIECP